MKSLPWALAFALVAGLSVSQLALGQNKPYTEGTVWNLTFIKLKPGMFDVYVEDAVVGRAREMAEAKKQGIVLSYKVLSGTSANREDWDILFMTASLAATRPAPRHQGRAYVGHRAAGAR